MTFNELISVQMQDPFRIMLLVGLIITMWRNRAATGVVLPLIAGAVFVAILIPSSTGKLTPAPFMQQVWTGLVANAIWIAIILGLWEAFRRSRGT